MIHEYVKDPLGSSENPDLFVNNFIMVVSEFFFILKIQSKPLFHFLSHKHHHITTYGSVRIL